MTRFNSNIKIVTFLLILFFTNTHLCIAQQSKFTCKDWMKLDENFKTVLIGRVIQMNKDNGTIIKLSPKYYVDEIDKLISTYVETNNNEALNSSLGVTFHTIAAMEGDWDNGEDKLEHAKNLMGPDIFDYFKKNYPEKYKHLLELSKGKQSKK